MSEEFDIFDNINKLRNANRVVLPKLQTPKSAGKCLNKSFDFDSPSVLDVWLNEAVKQTSKKRNNTISNNCRKTKPKEKNQNESIQQSNENKQNKTISEENCEIQKSKSTNKRKTRKQKEKTSTNTEHRLSPINPTVESEAIPDNINDGTLLERFIARRSQNRRRSTLRATRGSSIQQLPIDFIDLSSTPTIPVAVPNEQTIDLLSDDENYNNNGNNQQMNQINKALLDQSITDENPVVNVNIVWKGQMETFKLRKYQKFRNIFQIIADRENITINNLLFNIDNVIVGPDDTPESLNYDSLQCIGGRILDNSILSDMDKITNVKTNREDIIKLKIQSNKFKRPFYVDLQKTQHLRILYIKCSEELNLPVDKLTLSFDGDLIKHEDKPIDFEFEGGEVIDLHIKQ